MNASSYNMALDNRAYRSDPPCSETGITTKVSCSQTLTGRVMRQNLVVVCTKLYVPFKIGEHCRQKQDRWNSEYLEQLTLGGYNHNAEIRCVRHLAVATLL